MTTSKTEKAKAPLCPPLDHQKIDRLFPNSMISSTWDGSSQRPKTYVLAKIGHISAPRWRAVDAQGRSYGLGPWFDSTTGVGGVGAVALVAHVLKITPDEAARRLALFLVPTATGVPHPDFWDDAEAEK